MMSASPTGTREFRRRSGVRSPGAEREDVGPAVHRGEDRPSLDDRSDRLGLLGGHVGRSAAEVDRGRVALGQRLPGQVEVEEHRLAVAGDQDVGRLDVHVDEVAVVGVLQAVGDADADPADRLDVGGPGDVAPERPSGRRDRDRQAGLDPVDRPEDLAPRAAGRLDVVQDFEDLRQRRAAEEGHAEDLQAAIVEHLGGI